MMNALQAGSANRRTGPSGFLESLTSTELQSMPDLATSTQFPVPLAELFCHETDRDAIL
jgi:hypothetical protein